MPYSPSPCRLPGSDMSSSPSASSPPESNGRFSKSPQTGSHCEGPAAVEKLAGGFGGALSAGPVRWAGRRQTWLWRSEGLSEAEDWLGREASRPWGDPGRHLCRTYAVAKKRKPSTCRERGCWTGAAHPGPGVPAPLGVLRPPLWREDPLPAQPVPSTENNAVSEGRKMH